MVGKLPTELSVAWFVELPGALFIVWPMGIHS